MSICCSGRQKSGFCLGGALPRGEHPLTTDPPRAGPRGRAHGCAARAIHGLSMPSTCWVGLATRPCEQGADRGAWALSPSLEQFEEWIFRGAEERMDGYTGGGEAR